MQKKNSNEANPHRKSVNTLRSQKNLVTSTRHDWSGHFSRHQQCQDKGSGLCFCAFTSFRIPGIDSMGWWRHKKQVFIFRMKLDLNRHRSKPAGEWKRFGAYLVSYSDPSISLESASRELCHWRGCTLHHYLHWRRRRRWRYCCSYYRSSSALQSTAMLQIHPHPHTPFPTRKPAR